LWKGGDVGVIDNVLIDGTAAAVGRTAGIVRGLQTGYLYTYAFAMILGLVALMGGLWWVLRT
jgi:NADH-quinone oxidoreductase subunit L